MSTNREAMMTPRMTVRLRPFREEDYPRDVEIGSLSFPDEPWNVEEIRHFDASWDHTRYEYLRMMAEGGDGRVVGLGRISHMPWEFHPRKYSMNITVEPSLRRRGIGTAIYEGLIEELRRREAIVVRSWVSKETMAESIAFLVHRGFVEVQRGWQSHLDIAAFDFAQFAGAEERVARQGITLTTLDAERARNPDRVRKAYELDQACARDAPGIDEATEVSFEQFVASSIETPQALPDAFFLARDGDRYVGLSFLLRRLEQPDVLSQELTGVLREYRGRGIAMALKLQTVRYAREHGYREIRTGNDARNRPMLRINEAMEFVKQPAWITFEKKFE